MYIECMVAKTEKEKILCSIEGVGLVWLARKSAAWGMVTVLSFSEILAS